MTFTRVMQYIGITLLTIATLGLEVSLTRIFSVTFWYNFVFLIISIALLGTGLSGVLLSFGRPNRLSEKTTNALLAVFSLAFAATVVLAFLKINTINLDPGNAFRDTQQWWNMVEYYAWLILPFLFSGVTIGLIFTKYSRDINRFYFFDLVGAGIGCLIILLLVPNLGGESTVFAIALIGAGSALCFAIALHPLAALPVLLAGVLFWPHIAKAPEYVNLIGKVKDKRTIDGPIEYKTWNNFSFVVITDNGRQKGVNLDFACFTPIYQDGARAYGSHAIPFEVLKAAGKKPVVCLIGSGGGREVTAALDYGAVRTYAIEFNPTIVAVLKGKYAAYNGRLHEKPGVMLMEAEGRSFIRNSHENFDLIVQNNTLTQTASASGAYALAEDYVLTVESFMEYMGKLNEGGILYISQPKELGVRMVTIAIEAFRKLGRTDVRECVTSMASVGGYTREFIMIKKGAYTAQEIGMLTAMGRGAGLEIQYIPGGKRSTSHHQLMDAAFDPARLAQLYDESYTDIRPSTDDWPFFSQRVKFRNISHMISDLTREGYAKDRQPDQIAATLKRELKTIRQRLESTNSARFEALDRQIDGVLAAIRDFSRFTSKEMTEVKLTNGTVLKRGEVSDKVKTLAVGLIDTVKLLDKEPLPKAEAEIVSNVATLLGGAGKLDQWQKYGADTNAEALRAAATKLFAGNGALVRGVTVQTREIERLVKFFNTHFKDKSSVEILGKPYLDRDVKEDISRAVDKLEDTIQRPLLATYVKETVNDARGLKESFEIFSQSGYWDFKVLKQRLPQSLGILVINLAMALLFSLVCIVLPLAFFKVSGLKQLKPKGRFFLYFMALGFGFMFLEISLMQRFSLFLGHPIYAITTTLFAVLLSSGVGAFLTGVVKRLADPRFTIKFALLGIVTMTLLHITVVPVIFKAFLGMEMWIRVIVSFIVLMPLGLCLGMLFPSGIKWATENAPDAIPWAWGINGFASVLGSGLTVLMGMLWGFSAVILIALAVYTIGTLAFLTIKVVKPEGDGAPAA